MSYAEGGAEAGQEEGAYPHTPEYPHCAKALFRAAPRFTAPSAHNPSSRDFAADAEVERLLFQPIPVAWCTHH